MFQNLPKVKGFKYVIDLTILDSGRPTLTLVPVSAPVQMEVTIQTNNSSSSTAAAADSSTSNGKKRTLDSSSSSMAPVSESNELRTSSSIVYGQSIPEDPRLYHAGDNLLVLNTSSSSMAPVSESNELRMHRNMSSNSSTRPPAEDIETLSMLLERPHISSSTTYGGSSVRVSPRGWPRVITSTQMPCERPNKPRERPNKPREAPNKPREGSNKPRENKPRQRPNKPREGPNTPRERPNTPRERPASTSSASVGRVPNPDVEGLLCKVCYEVTLNLVLINPCGHTCMCSPCSSRCSKCPICNNAILGTHKVYLS